MDLGIHMKKSGRSYTMPEAKTCTTCGKEITQETAPRHLFYAGFCSEKCKGKYMEEADSGPRFR